MRAPAHDRSVGSLAGRAGAAPALDRDRLRTRRRDADPAAVQSGLRFRVRGRRRRDRHAIPDREWPWLALIGLSGALGQYWLTEAFRRAPPSVVGPFEYTSMVWAFAIDWLFWSASPSPSLLAGSAIVIASGIAVLVDEHRLAGAAVSPACPPP